MTTDIITSVIENISYSGQNFQCEVFQPDWEAGQGDRFNLTPGKTVALRSEGGERWLTVLLCESGGGYVGRIVGSPASEAGRALGGQLVRFQAQHVQDEPGLLNTELPLMDESRFLQWKQDELQQNQQQAESA